MSNTATALPDLNYKAMTEQQVVDAFEQALKVLTEIADLSDRSFQSIYDDFRANGQSDVVELWDEPLDGPE